MRLHMSMYVCTRALMRTLRCMYNASPSFYGRYNMQIGAGIGDRVGMPMVMIKLGSTLPWPVSFVSFGLFSFLRLPNPSVVHASALIQIYLITFHILLSSNASRSISFAWFTSPSTSYHRRWLSVLCCHSQWRLCRSLSSCGWPS